MGRSLYHMCHMTSKSAYHGRGTEQKVDKMTLSLAIWCWHNGGHSWPNSKDAPLIKTHLTVAAVESASKKDGS